MGLSSHRTLTWVGMIAGSLAGGWLPVAFGSDGISFASLVGSVAGGIAGVVIGHVIARRYF